MAIELTEQQQRELDGGNDRPPQVADPRTNAVYYLISSADYEAVREEIEDERRQQALRVDALQYAARRLTESP